MRHRVAGRHLGRDTAHRKSLYRNLVTDLLFYERITTTEAKAKEIRPIAERIITLGRKGDLHSRRQALRFVFDERVVRKVFDDIGPRMKDRPGGYLRITSLEPRKGDGAKMAAIELVDYVEAPPTARPQRVTAPAAAAAPAPAAVEEEATVADDAAEETAEAEASEAVEAVEVPGESEAEEAPAEEAADELKAEAPDDEAVAEDTTETVEAEADAPAEAEAEADDDAEGDRQA
jgi:large subunit ribosomal protein L17